ncbi:hypothetical protein HNR44_001364 [Geomicrobium halophilum]|uniref:YtkA-like n=1 Tax=Geomicrobium halophilum TaxID=549000 RepID=A0A841PYT3_9BACL|nr:hypothetical protein [Geomicrobium halophilum]MBB6449415.1 hypothetical protein [Geomicrobium halophilum]
MSNFLIGVVACLVLGTANGSIPDLEVQPLPVMKSEQQELDMQFNVDYDVWDGQVYVESYIPSFSFYENDHQPEVTQGYLMLRVDGEYEEEINQAAFIIKGLESGEHFIELEVYDQNDQPLGLKESFSLSIPE